MKNIIYIIDPQSVNSLANYDWHMIENIIDVEIHFFGNTRYNGKDFKQNVKFTPIYKYSKYSNPVLKAISYFISLIKIFFWGIRERPKAFHMQWIRVWILDWLFIRCFKSILKTQFIFTVHNILPRNRNRKTFYHFKKLYHFSDRLVVHTETTKNDLEKKFNVSSSIIIVMPHGLLEMNISEVELKDAEQTLNEKYKFSDKIVFGALGVQSPYKGTDLLIDAWIKSKELSTSTHSILLIAGKSSGINIPDNLPNNIVIISRLLSNAEFKYLLNRTDVMVLPYREIDQSGVLLSLINEEKPYCCTRAGELSRPIEQEDIGWIIEKCDEKSIAKVLTEINNNSSSITDKKNCSEGWKNLKDKYSWKRSNEILRHLYLDLLHK